MGKAGDIPDKCAIESRRGANNVQDRARQEGLSETPGQAENGQDENTRQGSKHRINRL